MGLWSSLSSLCTMEQPWAGEGFVLNLGAQHQTLLLGPGLCSICSTFILYWLDLVFVASLWLPSLHYALASAAR